MAYVIAVSWIPRSNVHMYETYSGLKKTKLDVKDISYDRELSFTLPKVRGYENVRFTQDWSGLHSFQVELPDDDVISKSREFMAAMQVALVEDLFKECHTVTYKQVVNDIVPINFHVIIFSGRKPDLEGYSEKKAGSLTFYYDPRGLYDSGTISYVHGQGGREIMDVLMYHAYCEVVCDFILSMQKKMTRLYHEADSAVTQIESATEFKAIRDSILVVDEVLKESAESYGKLKQARSNMGLKRAAFREQHFTGLDQEIVDALDIDYYFKALISDADYAMSLWSDVLIEYIKNVGETFDARLMMISAEGKGKGSIWPF
ncbi:MAG: hypothetical protein ABIH11_06345 [Candidatus Altiarchaeota archaeon]